MAVQLPGTGPWLVPSGTFLTPSSSGTFTSMESEPVSLLIMAVRSFQGEEDGVSSHCRAGGAERVSSVQGTPGDTFGACPDSGEPEGS